MARYGAQKWGGALEIHGAALVRPRYALNSERVLWPPRDDHAQVDHAAALHCSSSSSHPPPAPHYLGDSTQRAPGSRGGGRPRLWLFPPLGGAAVRTVQPSSPRSPCRLNSAFRSLIALSRAEPVRELAQSFSCGPHTAFQLWRWPLSLGCLHQPQSVSLGPGTSRPLPGTGRAVSLPATASSSACGRSAGRTRSASP